MLTAQPLSTGVPLIPRGRRPDGVETTCATVLFADLHGYGALAEKLPPVEVVTLLDEFFTLLSAPVLEWGGQILHLAEADLMAGFGIGDCRHTRIHEAIAAARAIHERFAAVRASWQARYSIDTAVAIGIDCGDVAVGVFGAPEHEGLTLVGDAVNVAAQLCRRARAGEVLMSATVAAVEPGSLLHLRGLRLRGRSAPVDVWCAPVPQRLEMRQETHSP